jgi:valyl-tRNA synthetase
VRNVRAQCNIPPSTPIQLYVRCEPDVAGDLQAVSGQFDNLAKAVLAAAGAEVVRPPASANFTLGDADGFVPLEGVIDVQSERARQEKKAAELRKFIAGHEKKLTNENFVSKAPEHVVADVRQTLANLQGQLQSVEEIIAALRAD